jgi:predicted dithiol-disulfide oxidoreductase (DUF899 family)
MVRIEKDYAFEGPGGKAGLLDLFDGRRQLIVRHFMFDPSWDEGCPSCSAGADEISDGLLQHLHTRDTSFVVVSRAPLEKIEKYKARKGWTFPWYSSYGSDFNRDFHVTLDESVAPIEYNYRTKVEHERAGTSAYVDQLRARRRDDRRFATSTSPHSAARKTGRSRRVVRPTHAVPFPTSQPEPRGLRSPVA